MRKTVWESLKKSIQRKIGNFSHILYIQQIEKLAYRHSYYTILGKHHVADVIHKAFESTPGDISTWSDYAEQSIFEPNFQLQS